MSERINKMRSRAIKDNSLKESYKVNDSALLEFNSKKNIDEQYIFWKDNFGANYFYTYTELLKKHNKTPDKTIMKDFGMFTVRNVNTNNNVSFVFSSSKRDEFGDICEEIWESTIDNGHGKKWKLIIFTIQ